MGAFPNNGIRSYASSKLAKSKICKAMINGKKPAPVPGRLNLVNLWLLIELFDPLGRLSNWRSEIAEHNI